MPSRRPTPLGGGAGRKSGGARSGEARSGATRSGATRSGSSRSGATRSGSSRPAAASAGRTVKDTDRPEGRPALLRPLTALLGTAVIIVLMLAPSVKPWLDQRSRITHMRETVALDRQYVTALEAERKRWSDPEYVKAQARERLHYVLPGETGYVVVDDVPRLPVPGETVEPRTAPRTQPVPDRPWYVDLWRSVGGTDDGATGGTTPADPQNPSSDAEGTAGR